MDYVNLTGRDSLHSVETSTTSRGGEVVVKVRLVSGDTRELVVTDETTAGEIKERVSI